MKTISDTGAMGSKLEYDIFGNLRCLPKDPFPSGRIGKLQSSCGMVFFDTETGYVLSCDLEDLDEEDPNDSMGYPDGPAIVDVEEWCRAYGLKECPEDAFDILDFGYWTESGVYEPPTIEWREERDRNKEADLL